MVYRFIANCAEVLLFVAGAAALIVAANVLI